MFNFEVGIFRKYLGLYEDADWTELLQKGSSGELPWTGVEADGFTKLPSFQLAHWMFISQDGICRIELVSEVSMGKLCRV